MPRRSVHVRRPPPVRPITRPYAAQDVPVTEVEKRDVERARANANHKISKAHPAMVNIADSLTVIELRAAIDAYERKYGKFVADAQNAAFRKHDDLANVIYLALARAFYEDFGFPCTAGDSDDWDLRRLEKQDRCFRQLQRTCKNDAAAMRAHAANPVRLVLENPYPHDHPCRLDFNHELRDWANKMHPPESPGPAAVNADTFQLAILNPYTRDPERCVEGHLNAVYMGMLLTDMVHDHWEDATGNVGAVDLGRLVEKAFLASVKLDRNTIWCSELADVWEFQLLWQDE
ncbi:hypothetical protein GGX14DRAFT_404910 [Mycena pura]|uniref:Uncharacterized protein n=1 Tax=Mycena pura TaxID=153505 RepID=A0AAD6XZQ5_9AGAR|nr:hypothetical protein GGX14DRAFT_404910 [Mycena pura]